MPQPKTLLVAAIKNGTVIDHIPAGQALKIIRVLNLAAHQKLVTVGLNLPSRFMGLKDLIKVAERELTPDEANQVAILAPLATINIIKNYQVAKKFRVKIPEKIERLLACPNPKCVTNHEPTGSSFLISAPAKKDIKLQCRYCEKVFAPADFMASK